MSRVQFALIAGAFLLVGCADTDTRTRTVTPEEKKEAAADAMNTRETGKDADMVGTDNENDPHKDDVPDKK